MITTDDVRVDVGLLSVQMWTGAVIYWTSTLHQLDQYRRS